MSSAAATPPAAGAGKGKKKLIIILVAVLLVLGIAGGAAVFLLKKKSAGADEEHAAAEEAAPAHTPVKVSPGTPPTYLPLDPFVVNLADKETERYAQVAVTLEVDDPKFAEQMKAYMPSIRNAILMILAHKTSTELLDRAGKEALAEEIMRESVRPMGIDIDPPEDESAEEATTTKKKKRRRAEVHNPVRHVHFANFIIQ